MYKNAETSDVQPLQPHRPDEWCRAGCRPDPVCWCDPVHRGVQLQYDPACGSNPAQDASHPSCGALHRLGNLVAGGGSINSTLSCKSLSCHCFPPPNFQSHGEPHRLDDVAPWTKQRLSITGTDHKAKIWSLVHKHQSYEFCHPILIRNSC